MKLLRLARAALPASGSMALVAGLALVSTSVPARAMGIAHCDRAGIGYAGVAAVDPVVQRGSPVSMHEHYFFGSSTLLQLPDPSRASYQDLVGGPTTCDIATDSAAYWAPVLYVAGQPIGPVRQEAYYRSWLGQTADYSGITEPLPADARLVVGNSMATSASDVDLAHVAWSCGLFSTKPSNRVRFATPADADCATATNAGDPTKRNRVLLTEQLRFPSCWDGNLNDHAVDGNVADYDGDPMAGVVNHFAYRVRQNCPPGYPHHVTELALNISYPYRGDGQDVTLASGPGYTLHADFLNAWPAEVMQRLVSTCIDLLPGTPEQSVHQGSSAATCGPPLFSK